MVASQAVMEQGPLGVVMEMTAAMESFAASGEWERVEDIAQRIRHAVMAVPEDQRRSALVEAQRGMEQVRTLALEAKNDVTGKLSALKRGADARKAYAAVD